MELEMMGREDVNQLPVTANAHQDVAKRLAAIMLTSKGDEDSVSATSHGPHHGTFQHNAGGHLSAIIPMQLWPVIVASWSRPYFASSTYWSS
jgi:hypothetical protein